MAHYHRGHKMVNTDLLFKKAQLQPGMHVGDFGCGRTGHIIFPASEIVGEDGLIYAVDILKDVLRVVRKRAKLNNVSNIHTVWADLEKVGHTSIPEDSIDVGFLVNTLCQSSDHKSIIKEVSRLLKFKSRLVVVDWSEKNIPFGPNKEDYVDFEKIKKIGKDEGFVVQEEFEMGNYHRGVIFFRHE